MERIKQALDRARKEREGKEPEARATRERPGAKRGLPAEVTDLTEISYSRTREFEFSEEWLAERRIITGLGQDPVTDAYRLLRTQVQQRMRLKGWNTLAVTSAGPGEGKTLTSINLAISLARDVNHTVMLCDVDLKRPRVHEYFALEGAPGLSDYLLGDATLPDMLFNPGIPRLVVLPGRESVAGSSDALASPKMVQLVEEMKTRYPSRLVVFDLPPLTAADDVLAFSPNVDAVLLVVAAGKTPRDQVKQAVEMLGSTPLIGTVLNRARESLTTNYYY